MKNFPAIFIASVGALMASLLLARVHPFGKVNLYAPHPSPGSIVVHASMPPEVQSILTAKCADCHSALTRAPIYGHFAPISWLMERDIVEARKAMNLSKWESYSVEEQEALKVKILFETRAHKMPPLQYRVIHQSTRLTNAEMQAITAWAKSSALALPGLATQVAMGGDATRGKDVYERRCTGCHAMKQNREGPKLQGVYGSVSGSIPDFTYSPALKSAHIVWNETTLEQWLTDPDALVPGNSMEFHVARPQERKDLIRYLRDGTNLLDK
jgi:cytochrome c